MNGAIPACLLINQFAVINHFHLCLLDIGDPPTSYSCSFVCLQEYLRVRLRISSLIGFGISPPVAKSLQEYFIPDSLQKGWQFPSFFDWSVGSTWFCTLQLARKNYLPENQSGDLDSHTLMRQDLKILSNRFHTCAWLAEQIAHSSKRLLSCLCWHYRCTRLGFVYNKLCVRSSLRVCYRCYPLQSSQLL